MLGFGDSVLKNSSLIGTTRPGDYMSYIVHFYKDFYFSIDIVVGCKVITIFPNHKNFSPKNASSKHFLIIQDK